MLCIFCFSCNFVFYFKGLKGNQGANGIPGVPGDVVSFNNSSIKNIAHVSFFRHRVALYTRMLLSSWFYDGNCLYVQELFYLH